MKLSDYEFTYNDRLLLAQEAMKLCWQVHGDLFPCTETCMNVAMWWAIDWSPRRATDEMPEYSRMVRDLTDWVAEAVNQWS
jgi:hypothetical protein